MAAAIGYGKLSMRTLEDAGVHAQQRGRPEAVAQIVKTILAEPLKEDDEFRAKSLVAIARAGALRRPAETQKLLLSITPLIGELKSTEYTPEIRKDFAVALAEAGSVRNSIEHIPGIVNPYFITAALIEIGSLFGNANDNAPGQIVILGDVETLQAAAQAFRALGARVMDLPVGGAFHSPLMADGETAFEPVLEAASFRDGRVPVVSNYTGRSCPDRRGREGGAAPPDHGKGALAGVRRGDAGARRGHVRRGQPGRCWGWSSVARAARQSRS